jgi:hypothetical protein
VRDEPRGERRRDTCVVAALTGDVEPVVPQSISSRGNIVRCSERPKGVDGGRGNSWARWSEVRRSCVERKTKGRRGLGPAASQAGGGKWLGHVERETWEGGGGPGSGVRCEVAPTRPWAGELRRARWCAG